MQKNTLNSVTILTGVIALLAMAFQIVAIHIITFRAIQIFWLSCQPGLVELWRVKKTPVWEHLIQNFHTNCFFIFIPGTLQHAQ